MNNSFFLVCICLIALWLGALTGIILGLGIFWTGFVIVFYGAVLYWATGGR